MTSHSDETPSGLTISEWQQQTGLGNPETLRKLLIKIEENWQVKLTPKGGVGRLISPEVGQLLQQAYAQGKSKNSPVMDELLSLLATSQTPEGIRRAIEQGKLEKKFNEDLQERLEQFMTELERQVAKVLTQNQQLLDRQNASLKQSWNDQWKHSFRKAELSFDEKFAQTNEAYQSALATFTDQLDSDATQLDEVGEQVSILEAKVRGLTEQLQKMANQASQAEQLNQKVEKLTAAVGQLVSSSQTLQQSQQQQQKQVRAGAAQLLQQAKRWQYLVPAAVTFGTLIGSLLVFWLWRSFPQWMVLPIHQFAYLMILLILAVALLFLFWRDEG